jgi:hypothetical protein
MNEGRKEGRKECVSIAKLFEINVNLGLKIHPPSTNTFHIKNDSNLHALSMTTPSQTCISIFPPSPSSSSSPLWLWLAKVLRYRRLQSSLMILFSAMNEATSPAISP